MVKSGQILVTRSSMPPFKEYCEEIWDLWESHWLTNCGVKHEELRGLLKDYLRVSEVDLFVNGHSALECTLEAMGLGNDGRDEVITTPFTFASTTNAIVRKGLKPVFCDIKPDDYTLDPEKIESLITGRTCAIVPVHVYGNVCDVDAIQSIANAHGLKVVYDAAHAFGVEVDGVGVGAFGDASMFSFHATKVYNTIEGGAVTHSDPVFSEKLAQWRNFGITGPEEVTYAGGNSKMNEFAAAMGICNLRYVDKEIAKRKVVVGRYRSNLQDIPGLQFCEPKSGVRNNYSYLPILVNERTFGATRDKVVNMLALHNIGARKYFYPLTSAFSYCSNDCAMASTPVARLVSSRVLTLPLYADLGMADVDRISSIVRSCSA